MNISGSLNALATGPTEDVTVTTNIVGLDISALVTGVLPLLQTPAGALLDPEDGVLANLGSTLSTTVEPIILQLDGILELVDEVVQVTANVQQPFPSVQGETFEVIGLRVSLLDTEFSAIPTALQLNLARGLVNATAADPVPATLTGINPDEGPLAGGNDVVISGTDFGDNPTVYVDGTAVPAADVTNNGDGTLTVTMPPGAEPGEVDITVDNGEGAGPSDPLTYTYLADPTPAELTSIDPAEGPLAGGNDVVISGTDFGDNPTVYVDGAAVPAADVTDNGDGTLTVTMPPGTAPGEVDVTVDNGEGAGPSDPLTYTYLADPTPAELTSIDPDEGPLAGGNNVVISGTDFGDDPTVYVDGAAVPAADVTDNGDGTLTVTMPPGTAPGEVDVTVDNGEGAGPSDPLTYTYLDDAEPTTPADITGIDPDEGPLAGGNNVVISGTDFGDNPVVYVDGAAVPAADVTDNGDGTLTVTMPAGTEPGPVDVTVDNGEGAGPSDPLTYTYLEEPEAATLTSIDPNEGPLAGGNAVTISGDNFGDDPTVYVDGAAVPAADVTDNGDGTLTVTMPAGTEPGPVDVTVDNGNGESEPVTYTYLAEEGPGDDDGDNTPVISDVTPDTGPTDGGTNVVIEGENLDQVTDVTIGGVSVAWQLQPDGTITFVTPAHDAGVAEIVLSSAAGDAVAYFTYEAQSSSAGPLPRTGADVGPQIIALALLLLAAGGAMTLVARRERHLG